MKLQPSETNEKSLAQFGKEAASYIESGNFEALAKRFGYALAYGRDCALAIQEDFEKCLLEAAWPSAGHEESILVKYFNPNSTRLFAVVECVVPIGSGKTVLAELIVSGSDEKHISLEEISFVS